MEKRSSGDYNLSSNYYKPKTPKNNKTIQKKFPVAL